MSLRLINQMHPVFCQISTFGNRFKNLHSTTARVSTTCFEATIPDAITKKLISKSVLHFLLYFISDPLAVYHQLNGSGFPVDWLRCHYSG